MYPLIVCASHIPLLAKAFSVSEGDVCELGTGPYSTTLLRWLCELTGRNLYSYESSRRWFWNALKDPVPYHKIYKVDDWDKADIERHWGLAFVDHKPGKRRFLEIQRLANFAEYIVIHDTNPEYFGEYHYERIWPFFKYRHEDRWFIPYTSIVSNFHSLENFK